MTVDEFASAVGLDGDQLLEAHQIFREELEAPQKTLAARSADLADGLRHIGVDEDGVFEAVRLLARERRR